MQGLYALEDRVLGKGSFGTVYLGVDIAKDRYVSLKKIPLEIKDDPQKINALSNEILISAGVDNENLVKILDLTDIEKDKYIVYEFCNGGDLRRYLRYFKRFDERAVQYFTTQVLNGLNELHDKKIIYNILLKSKIKVSDFGLSKFKEDNNEKMLGGSPLYMDPNLFEPNVDIKTIENEKVDVWAVGIFAYELFFGKRPFNSPSQSLKELIQILKVGKYSIDLKECGKVSKQFLSFLNMCLQRPQKIRPNVTELLFSEFITRDTNKFEYITLDNVESIKFPGPNYYQNQKVITMNIDDQRSINANFDY